MTCGSPPRLPRVAQTAGSPDVFPGSSLLFTPGPFHGEATEGSHCGVIEKLSPRGVVQWRAGSPELLRS